MTALSDKLKRRIAATGPINIAQFMHACLMDPEHGYYTTRDPFGRSGDFTTAPEISQIFGEMIGLCLAQCWLDQNRPAPFALTELGPGRGTLMADILRTIRAVPGMAEVAQVHLVETSPTLRQVQAETLGPRVAPHWHDSVSDLPALPLYAVANEFFDALPIRQFQRGEGPTWLERQVGLDPAGELTLGLAPPVPLGELEARLADTAPGDVVELCPALPGIVADLSARIAGNGGAVLIIDYGGWHSLGDTLQAVREHKACKVLDWPGASDLTAHVDFETIAKAAAETVSVTRMTLQGVFLERLGITERARALAARLTGDTLGSHVAAHRRLTHPDEMGSLFKVIALFPQGAQTPSGLSI